MRISDWSSDVCSSDLAGIPGERYVIDFPLSAFGQLDHFADVGKMTRHRDTSLGAGSFRLVDDLLEAAPGGISQQFLQFARQPVFRSEEHTSELQSLLRISYAVFCLKKNNRLQLKITKR